MDNAKVLDNARRMTGPLTPDANLPGLLAMLYTKGLVRQVEVAVTQSIVWLCAGAAATNPLDPLIRRNGLVPEENVSWLAEVLAPDRSRTDLECWWGDPPHPHVVVEAKLDHEITVEQLLTYLRHLHERIGEDQETALLVVLVPEHRRGEASTLLNGVLEAERSRVRSDVWSYDEVLTALSDSLGQSSDLGQLRGLVEVCESLDIKPFTLDQIRTVAPDREPDIISILNRASASFFAGEAVLPSSPDKDFTWRRYIEVHPAGTFIAVGVRRSPRARSASRHWAWVRLHHQIHNPTGGGNTLLGAFPEVAERDEAGATWVPLTIPPGLSGAALQSNVVDQLRRLKDLLGPRDE